MLFLTDTCVSHYMAIEVQSRDLCWFIRQTKRFWQSWCHTAAHRATINESLHALHVPISTSYKNLVKIKERVQSATCRISTDLTWEHVGTPTTPLISERCDAVVCCPSLPSQPALPPSSNRIPLHQTSTVRSNAKSVCWVICLLIVKRLLSFDSVFSIPIRG